MALSHHRHARPHLVFDPGHPQTQPGRLSLPTGDCASRGILLGLAHRDLRWGCPFPKTGARPLGQQKMASPDHRPRVRHPGGLRHLGCSPGKAVALTQLNPSKVAIVQSSQSSCKDIQYAEIKTMVENAVNLAGGFTGVIRNGDTPDAHSREYPDSTPANG
ncbi:MAG TPA: hypothetical protein VHY08_09675 [Bacillota bacterium]|nr:hypothetical protein [Bacillota bacterium]